MRSEPILPAAFSRTALSLLIVAVASPSHWFSHMPKETPHGRILCFSRAGIGVALLFVVGEFFFINVCREWDCMYGLVLALPWSSLAVRVMTYLYLSHQLLF